MFRWLSSHNTSHTTLCYYHTRCLRVNFDITRVWFNYLLTAKCCAEAPEEGQWMFLSRNEWSVFKHPASRGEWWTHRESTTYTDFREEMKDVEERSGTQWHHHSTHPAQLASKGQERCNRVCVPSSSLNTLSLVSHPLQQTCPIVLLCHHEYSTHNFLIGSFDITCLELHWKLRRKEEHTDVYLTKQKGTLEEVFTFNYESFQESWCPVFLMVWFSFLVLTHTHACAHTRHAIPSLSFCHLSL